MNKVYNNIYELRKAKGLSQMDLADKLNINQDSVSKLERGKIQLTIERLELLAEIFGMTVFELLQYGGETVQQPQIIDNERVKELESRIKELESIVKDKDNLLEYVRNQVVDRYIISDFLVDIKYKAIYYEDKFKNKEFSKKFIVDFAMYQAIKDTISFKALNYSVGLQWFVDEEKIDEYIEEELAFNKNVLNSKKFKNYILFYREKSNDNVFTEKVAKIYQEEDDRMFRINKEYDRKHTPDNL